MEDSYGLDPYTLSGTNRFPSDARSQQVNYPIDNGMSVERVFHRLLAIHYLLYMAECPVFETDAHEARLA